MSYVVIEGSVTTKPTLRTFERAGRSGSVANFLVAVKDRVKDGDQWGNSYPEVYDVAVFGDLGQRTYDNLSPGDRVVVTGTVTKLGHNGEAMPTHYDTDVADSAAGPDSPISDAWFNRRLQADHVGISLRFLESGEYSRRSRKQQQATSRRGE